MSAASDGSTCTVMCPIVTLRGMSRPASRHEAFARAALPAYGREPDMHLRLLSLSENATWLADDERPMVLRVHRPGYHTLGEIESELDWTEALRRETVVRTPAAIETVGGERVTEVSVDGETRLVDAVEFVQAVPAHRVPDAISYRSLGALTAVMHEHASTWRPPASFTRFRWDLGTILGPRARWGDWRAAPGLAATHRDSIEQAASEVARRLTVFGEGPDRFGLIHGDLWLANLLIDPDDPDAGMTIIDFDDCGWSWYLADLAAAVASLDDRATVDRATREWLAGYLDIRALPDEHLAMIPTLVMLRRINLTAWVASHEEATQPLQGTADFGPGTAQLAERYLGDPAWLRDAVTGA